MYSISLKNNKEFLASEDETLVAAAKNAGIVLEHSCLLGRCSSCKVQVKSGSSIPIMEEISLNEDEKKNGFILSCVRSPTSNMTLETEDLGELGLNDSRTIPAKIDEVLALTNDVVKISLRLPPKESFLFHPGQYVNIIKGSVRRSYSIAGRNPERNTIEFFIKKYPGGVLSKYWFETATVNDLLRIEGPKGTFFLRNTHAIDNIIFMATGTGIAPVKSILESLTTHHTAEKEIFLFWGGRYSTDFFIDPLLYYGALQYYPVVSREPDSLFDKGYVQDVLLNKNLNLKRSVIYACGSDSMIKEARTKLISGGLLPENFYSDSFVNSN